MKFRKLLLIVWLTCKILLILTSFLFFLLIPLPQIPSIIEKTDNLDYLWKNLDKLNKQTLVIFDIDKVLLAGASSINRGTKEQRKEIKQIFKQLPKGYKNYLRSKAILERRRMLVDAHTPQLIRELQKKQIPHMALTMCLAGPYKLIDNLENFRLQELEQFNIDMSKTFIESDNISLISLSCKNRHPLFKSGVLFTCGCNKGESLEAFLHEINWIPDKVIFIDNKLSNLKAVQHSLRKLQVPFIGLYYQGAQKIPGTFDKKLVKFQIKHLIKHNQLLDDRKARSLMKKQRVY